MVNPDEQLHTVREEAGFKRPVSKGLYYRTKDVNDGNGNFIASCTEYTQPRTHRDSEIKLWVQKTQRSDQFVMSKLSVIMADMESKFKSPLHLETTPMFGWSYPEAQIATWMSYDSEIEKILLKKLITNACRTRIKSNRLFNWICQTITFRFLTRNGKTSLPMNSVTDTRGNPPSYP